MGSLADMRMEGEERNGRGERDRETEKGGVKEEMRPKDKGTIFVKVGIIKRLVHCKLINLTMKCFRD